MRGFHACASPLAIITGGFGYDRDDALLEVDLGDPAKIKTDGSKTVSCTMTVLRRVSWPEAIGKTGTMWCRPAPSSIFRTFIIHTFNLEGVLHSYNDLPAVKSEGGNGGEWYKNGKRHRDGGLPAVVNDKEQEWWVDGKRHRDDGLPAVENNNEQEWWVDGKLLHRAATAKVPIRETQRCFVCKLLTYVRN
jgi:hypothetical protein